MFCVGLLIVPAIRADAIVTDKVGLEVGLDVVTFTDPPDPALNITLI